MTLTSQAKLYWNHKKCEVIRLDFCTDFQVWIFVVQYEYEYMNMKWSNNKPYKNIKPFFLVFSSAEKLAEAQRRFATLQNELQSSLDAQRESNAPPGLRKRKTMFHLSQEERCKHHNIKDLKLAFSEFYLSLILLQNYQVSAQTIMYCHTHMHSRWKSSSV